MIVALLYPCSFQSGDMQCIKCPPVIGGTKDKEEDEEQEEEEEEEEENCQAKTEVKH